jgi:hypothetical protein
MRHLPKSARLTQWFTIPFILVIGLVLWVGVLSDPSGHLRTPSLGPILYVAAVIGVATFLALTDRNGDSSEKDRQYPPRKERGRNATTR